MTTEELLAELESIYREAADPEGFHTSEELADMAGVAVSTIRRRLKAAARLGRLERAEVQRINLKGHQMPVVAYRIK